MRLVSEVLGIDALCVYIFMFVCVYRAMAMRRSFRTTTGIHTITAQDIKHSLHSGQGVYHTLLGSLLNLSCVAAYVCVCASYVCLCVAVFI